MFSEYINSNLTIAFEGSLGISLSTVSVVQNLWSYREIISSWEQSINNTPSLFHKCCEMVMEVITGLEAIQMNDYANEVETVL